MGTASKGASVFLRFVELVSAAVVAGLIGEYLHNIDNAHAHANSRIVYAITMAGISLVASIVLFPPLNYTFFFFPLDYALFVCWMVVFGLLANVSNLFAWFGNLLLSFDGSSLAESAAVQPGITITGATTGAVITTIHPSIK